MFSSLLYSGKRGISWQEVVSYVPATYVLHGVTWLLNYECVTFQQEERASTQWNDAGWVKASSNSCLAHTAAK